MATKKYLDKTGLEHLVDKLDARYQKPITSSNPLSALNVQVTDVFESDVNAKTAFSNLKNNKQDKLVSGTNIKTINGNSILGSGNIEIGGGGGSGMTCTLLTSGTPIQSVASYGSYTFTGVTVATLRTYKLVLACIVTGPGFEVTVLIDPTRVNGDGVMLGYDNVWWRFNCYGTNPSAMNMTDNTQYMYDYKIYGIK